MNYIPLKVLQKAYCEHNITEFLKRVESLKVLKNTNLLLLANDITEETEGIISALVTEIQYRNNGVKNYFPQIPVETLKYMYANHRLMEYLKNTPTDILSNTYSRIVTNYISEDMEGILSGIITELEYRNQEKQKEIKTFNIDEIISSLTDLCTKEEVKAPKKVKELSIEFLELLSRNYQLTDYLKTYESNDEIKRMINLINADDITEERARILSALLTEDEYRTQLEKNFNVYMKRQGNK